MYWTFSLECRNSKMSWKQFRDIKSLKTDVFIKGLVLQYYLSTGLMIIPVNKYENMNIIISSIGKFFHFLKCKWCGNLRFTCMYWAAYIFVCVARILKKSSSRKEINKANSLLIIRKFRINFTRSYEFWYGSGIIPLFPNLIKPLLLLPW